MNNYKLLIIFLFFLLTSLQHVSSQNYTLKNDNIEVSIDNSGNLIILRNIHTGTNYASGKPMWRLYYETKGQKDIEILSTDNKPSIYQSANQIYISYNNLRSGEKDLEFKLSLRIVIEDSAIRFCSDINNNELHTIIRELQYPLLGDCQLPKDHQLLTTDEGGMLYPHPIKAIKGGTYIFPDEKFHQKNLSYPYHAASNCFALIGENDGLYIGSHDTTFQDTGHGLRLYPDNDREFKRLEVGLYKYPNCLFGEFWSCSANVIIPYNGDWHQTSKIYRSWSNTWWNHRKEPLWVRQMTGFQRIILKHQYGETLFSYSDFSNEIKKTGDEAGINTVFPFGWWSKGMDNGYPDYSTDLSLGGDQEWEKAIKDYQHNGDKVILYFNGQLIDTESEYYTRVKDKDVCFKTNTGENVIERYHFGGSGSFVRYYGDKEFAVADVRNSTWQNVLINMVDQTIKFGANSVFYDQLGRSMSYNWDLSKEFPVPNLQNLADRANVLEKIHDYIDTKDSELAIGTENVRDATAQFVDYVHGGSFIGRSNDFLEWFRYTFPEIILSERHVYGSENNIKALVNRSFILGLRNNVQVYRLRGLVDELPFYQQYLAETNKLKKKFSQLLLEGTYKDSEGFFFDNKLVQAKSFINGKEMAIVITNTNKEKVTTQIFVPGYQFKEFSGIGNFNVLSKKGNKYSVSLNKDDVVVLVYIKD